MKKWVLLGASSILAFNVQAKENMACNYKDFFHLSDNTHPGIFVQQGFSEQDVILEVVGPRSFIIRDAYYCRAGYAHVTVSYGTTAYCVLDILDGPYLFHPTIRAACSGGLHYVNTTYDGFGSFSYSIQLDLLG